MTNNVFHLDDKLFGVFSKLAEGVVLSADPEKLRPYMKTNKYGVTAEQLSKIKPSEFPAFRGNLDKLFSSLPADKRALILRVFGTMRFKPVLGMLFNAPFGKSLDSMTDEEINTMLWSWYKSPLDVKRQLFKLVNTLTTVALIASDSLIYKAMNHPERFSNIQDRPNFHADYEAKRNDFRFEISRPEDLTSVVFDVIIVGSGSGGSVVASELSEKGYKVLVIEKGHYYSTSELDFSEIEAHEKLYENGAGLLTSEDASVMVLAGATLGGGSTINWSACLRLNPVVRKSWAESVPWINNSAADKQTPSLLDQAYDYVSDKMGCTTEFLTPGITDKKLKEGAEKLGLHYKDVPQNVGNQHHACGLCGAGCSYGVKQGGMEFWLKNAAKKGCKIIDDAAVLKINRDSSGKATGVDFILTKNNDRKRYRVKSTVVVAAGGTLQTPGLLKRSGFKNDHIGKHLKLHPVTFLSGVYPDEDSDNWNSGILTACIDDFCNLDSKGHGPLLEAMLGQPMYQALFVPFRHQEPTLLETMAFKNHCATILIITRDKGEGHIGYTKKDPLTPRLHYTPSDYDRNALGRGVCEASKILYVTGATQILPATGLLPVFKSDKPKDQRSVKDRDFVKWLSVMEKYNYNASQTGYGSAHQMGTCRMGRDPKSSAVNLSGALWESPNCFVADTSVYPSASGSNPMLTCMALAKVTSSNIADYLSKSEAVGTTPRL